MKYVLKLSDKEVEEIFKLCMASDEEFLSIEIKRENNSIDVTGYVRFPDNEIEGEMLEVEDNYELLDFDIKVYTHSGCLTKIYRKYMYEKFGEEYARDYLLGIN